MEITGKIIAVLEPASGVSARTNSPWKSQEFVLETHDQYPRKCCFKVFSEEKINRFKIQMGEELTVFFDIDAREYNGRWYNQINAWGVERKNQQPAAQTQPAAPASAPANDAPFPPASAAPADSNSTDDLPF